MNIYQFAVAGVIFSVVILIVKNQEKNIGLALGIASSLFLFFYIAMGVSDVLLEIAEIFSASGIDSGILTVVCKIIGIAYITEFASDICTEAGSSAIAKKVSIFGRITLLVQTLPLVADFIAIVGVLM